MMTHQEAFNIIVNGLRKQGKRSVLQGTCVFRGPKNRKCAIGFLIPDKKYSVEMEKGWEINDLINQEIIPNLSINFLYRMQFIHDEKEIDDLERLFQTVANDYNLTMPPQEIEPFFVKLIN